MLTAYQWKLSFAVGSTATLFAFGLEIAACSSSSDTANAPSDAGADVAPVILPKAACTDGGLTVAFDPMYSAYVSGSATPHTFQVPAVVRGSNVSVTWSADSAYVGMQQSVLPNEVLITVLKPGNVVINVNSTDGKCGSSVLEITAAMESDWQIGNARYNNGQSLHLQEGAPSGSPLDQGGNYPACTNCHGETATQGPFTDVSHTPEQTGGFSNAQLVNLITHGEWPDSGNPFDSNIVSYPAWHMFHQWADITADQQLGIIVYLRSLLPAAQHGSINFGMLPEGDSGSSEGDAESDAAETDAEPVADATADAAGDAGSLDARAGDAGDSAP